jgi:serine/threonine protein kinase
MFSPGHTIRSDGHAYQVVRSVGVGGEGEAYEVVDSEFWGRYLLKKFHEHHDAARVMRRMKYLQAKRLDRVCPLITPPLRLIRPTGFRTWCGYVASFRAGEQLDEFLFVPQVSLIDNLQLAIGVVHAVSVVHAAGISHGDLHLKNVIVDRVGDVLVPYLIDLDNFQADRSEHPGEYPGAGAEAMAWGALQYLAPETRRAMLAGKPSPPDIRADRFSLTCVLHEILFVRHVAAGHDEDPEAFNKAMTSGVWLQDPAKGPIPHETLGGVSNLVVNSDVARLFRRGLSQDPYQRPTADEWKPVLLKALGLVYLCPSCGYPNLIDASKQRCPACGQNYPVLAVEVMNGPPGIPIVIDQASVVVGRGAVRSTHVSDKHAVLRRIGPETWIEPLGRNGTYRWTRDGGWVRLKNCQRHLIEIGDRLRFADVEVSVVTANPTRGHSTRKTLTEACA